MRAELEEWAERPPRWRASLVPGVHRAKKSRNARGKTSCTRAGSAFARSEITQSLGEVVGRRGKVDRARRSSSGQCLAAPRPSKRKIFTACCPDGPGRQPVACAWASRPGAPAAAADGGRWHSNSGQGGRTGTFFGCIWLDTTVKVHSSQGCTAVQPGYPSPLRNDFGIWNLAFCLVRILRSQIQVA